MFVPVLFRAMLELLLEPVLIRLPVATVPVNTVMELDGVMVRVPVEATPNNALWVPS